MTRSVSPPPAVASSSSLGGVGSQQLPPTAKTPSIATTIIKEEEVSPSKAMNHAVLSAIRPPASLEDSSSISTTTKIEPTDDSSPNANTTGAISMPNAAAATGGMLASPSAVAAAAQHAASIIPNAIPGAAAAAQLMNNVAANAAALHLNGVGLNGLTGMNGLNGTHSMNGLGVAPSPLLNGGVLPSALPVPAPLNDPAASMAAAVASPSAAPQTESAPTSPSNAANGPGRPRKYTKRGANLPPKMFQCDICGKEFRRKFNMRVHKRTHLHHSKRPWACPHCNETFAQKSNFKRHVLTRHEKPIKCPSCKERFATELEVTSHLATVHPGDHKRARIRKVASRPKFKYRCPCKKKFDLLQDLVQHQSDCVQNTSSPSVGNNPAAPGIGANPSQVVVVPATASDSAASSSAAASSPAATDSSPATMQTSAAMAAAIAAASSPAAVGTMPPSIFSSTPNFQVSALRDPTLDPASRVGGGAAATPPPLENPDGPNATPKGTSTSPMTIKTEEPDTKSTLSSQASTIKLEQPPAAISTPSQLQLHQAMPGAAAQLAAAHHAMPALTITVQAQPGGGHPMPAGAGVVGGHGGLAGTTMAFPTLSMSPAAALSAQFNPAALLGTNFAQALTAQSALSLGAAAAAGGFPVGGLGIAMNDMNGAGGGSPLSNEQKTTQDLLQQKELLQHLAQSAAALIHAAQGATMHQQQGIGIPQQQQQHHGIQQQQQQQSAASQTGGVSLQTAAQPQPFTQ